MGKVIRTASNQHGALQEYLGIAGNLDFCKLSAKLAFGADSKALQEGRAATVQSLSGTGALRVSRPIPHAYTPNRYFAVLTSNCTVCEMTA